MQPICEIYCSDHFTFQAGALLSKPGLYFPSRGFTFQAGALLSQAGAWERVNPESKLGKE